MNHLQALRRRNHAATTWPCISNSDQVKVQKRRHSHLTHKFCFFTHTTTTTHHSQSAKHPTTKMAKSLRSKVKRDYRSKKREEGVYAVSEAARLHRLNTKLKTIVDAKKPEPEVFRRKGEEDLSSAGWSWFATFGLVDPHDITVDSISSLAMLQ